MAFGQALGGGQGQLVAIVGGQVEQGEGHVVWIAGQGLDAGLAGLAPGPRIDRPGRQLSQQGDLALADHPLSVVGIGADDAARRPVVVRDRAVGEGVVGLLRIAVALHDQELFLDVGPLDPAERGGEHRADLRPDLAPHLRRRPAQRPGVLAPDDRLVGIVVEVGQLRAPADPDRLARGEHDPHRGPEALGPGIGRAQRRPGPVVAADQHAHLAAACQEVQGRTLLRSNVRLSAGHEPPAPLPTHAYGRRSGLRDRRVYRRILGARSCSVRVLQISSKAKLVLKDGRRRRRPSAFAPDRGSPRPRPDRPRSCRACR